MCRDVSPKAVRHRGGQGWRTKKQNIAITLENLDCNLQTLSRECREYRQLNDCVEVHTVAHGVVVPAPLALCISCSVWQGRM